MHVQTGQLSGAPRPGRRLVAGALDGLIAIYAVSLGLFLVGLSDLGIASVNRAEKPLLVLLIVVPLRITLGGGSWLLDWARAAARPARLRPLVLDRLPQSILDVAFVVVTTRAASLFVGFAANVLFPPGRLRAFSLPFRRARFVEIFAAWDSGWYFDIAKRGYYWRADGQSSVAFFPLYPMLMRAVAWPFGGSDRALWLAGIGVSCAAFCLALLALHRFTERQFGDSDTARRAVLYIAIFPFSLFFTRVYAESVFLLTGVLAVSRAYDGRWWRAGLWGALATLHGPMAFSSSCRSPSWRCGARRRRRPAVRCRPCSPGGRRPSRRFRWPWRPTACSSKRSPAIPSDGSTLRASGATRLATRPGNSC